MLIATLYVRKALRENIAHSRQYYDSLSIAKTMLFSLLFLSHGRFDPRADSVPSVPRSGGVVLRLVRGCGVGLPPVASHLLLLDHTDIITRVTVAIME